MSGPILHVTGVNTGVGKTTLATLLLRRAREVGRPVAALKPFCSGGREDAVRLHELQGAGLTLDEVNPFHFSAPLAALAAARKEARAVRIDEAMVAIAPLLGRGNPVLIEGAGGLLSPLGEGFSGLELIQRIPGKVCIVATNQLGCLNQVLLSVRCLNGIADELATVLMDPERPDESAESNPQLLAELLPRVAHARIPFLGPQSAGGEGVAQVWEWWMGGPLLRLDGGAA